MSAVKSYRSVLLTLYPASIRARTRCSSPALIAESTAVCPTISSACAGATGTAWSKRELGQPYPKALPWCNPPAAVVQPPSGAIWLLYHAAGAATSCGPHLVNSTAHACPPPPPTSDQQHVCGYGPHQLGRGRTAARARHDRTVPFALRAFRWLKEARRTWSQAMCETRLGR